MHKFIKRIHLKGIFVGIFILLSGSVFADTVGLLELDSAKKTGPLSHEGFAKLTASQFAGKVQIKGRLKADGCQFQDEVYVEGRANLQQVVAEKKVSLRGMAEIFRSNFKADLKIEGDQGSSLGKSEVSGKIEFTGNDFAIVANSQIESIEISPSLEHPKDPVLTVKGGSKVLGTIRFNRPGKVIVESGAEIHQVVNGEVIRNWVFISHFVQGEVGNKYVYEYYI